MKTFGNLYPAIYDFKNLFNAYLKARQNKRYRKDVLEFSANLEENLIVIQNELIYHSFQTGKYQQFYVYEPKRRLVMALPFRDRVVHHALCNIIEPIFDRRFISDSYACRSGKGTHRGADRLTRFLREAKRKWGSVYCLKADIAQYFPSINHNILKAIIARRIRCKDTLWLINMIIDSTSGPDEINPAGIPIGNLTSQLFANIYLNELDWFIKRDKGIQYYLRYMDDFAIFHYDKGYLNKLKQEIEEYLAANLALHFNRKTSIFPIKQGVDFLGYRIWPTHRLLRKSSIKRIKKNLKRLARRYANGEAGVAEVRSAVASWVGHASHANTYRLRRRVLESVTFTTNK